MANDTTKEQLTELPEYRAVKQFDSLLAAALYWEREVNARKSPGLQPAKWAGVEYNKPARIDLQACPTLTFIADPPFNPKRFHSAIWTLLQDAGSNSTTRYTGYTSLLNGTVCYTFTGWCPVHERDHGSAKFQLQQHPKKDTAYWKCFRDGRSKAVGEVTLLQYK